MDSLIADATATITTALRGDANLDGTVNGADLNTVLSNYNKTGMSWAQGDFDGNGTVNGADLNTVLSNYNQHVGLSAAMDVGQLPTCRGAAVPEPCAASCSAGLPQGAMSCGCVSGGDKDQEISADSGDRGRTLG